MSEDADKRVQVVREVYQALNNQDLELISSLLADDCVRHFPNGESPISGDHRGRSAVLQSYAHPLTISGKTLRIEVGGIAANERLVVSYHHESARRASDGLELDSDMLVKWRFETDKIAEISDYAQDIPHLDRFLCS